MQGWVPNFLPKIAGDAVDAKHYDRVVRIADADALRASRTLARTEGILVGITAGATLAGALAVAKDAPKGTTILAMLPDTGERYLSTPLFADIAVDMTEEELAISRSTPGFQLPAPAPATP
jgi:cysteine synthase A